MYILYLKSLFQNLEIMKRYIGETSEKVSKYIKSSKNYF